MIKIKFTIIYSILFISSSFLIISYQPNPYKFIEKNLIRMTSVIELVKKNELAISENIVSLPPEYKDLSDTGEIVVLYDDNGGYRIKFFIFRGLILSKSKYFLYIDNINVTTRFELKQLNEVKELIPKWYLVYD